MHDPIPIIVDSRLRLPVGRLSAEVVELLRVEFTHTNPQHEKLKRMGVSQYALRAEPPTIESWSLEGDMMTFPRGGIGRIRAVLAEAGLEWKVIDNRTDGTGPRGMPPHRVELRDYQRVIVKEAARIQNCVVRAPTGSGKTTAALALIAQLGLPALVIVWTKGLLDQWVRRVMQEFSVSDSDVGVIAGGVKRIRPITIGMQQSLVKCAAGLVDVFGVVIADELQRFAARTFAAAVDVMPARYRIGISADERRKDRKQFLIYDCFGDIAVDISHDLLVAQGVVHDVEVRVVPTTFEAEWYGDLQRRLKEAEAELRDKGTPIPRGLNDERMGAFDRLVGEMMVDPERGRLAVDLAAVEIEAGEQAVMMSHRREHCRRLDADLSARGIRCGLMLGGDAEEYDRALSAMLEGSLRAVAGTYQAIGQGIDLPSASVGVCASPIANSRDGRSFFKQVRGRLCRTREGKSGARIYYLLDERVYGVEPVRNLCRWNNTVRVRDTDGQWVGASTWLERRSGDAKA